MGDWPNVIPGLGASGVGLFAVVFVARLLLKITNDVGDRYETALSVYRKEIAALRTEVVDLRDIDRACGRRVAALEAEVVRLGGNPDRLARA